MAGNVFGNPVTDEVVKELYPGKEVTRKLKAEVAFEFINSGGKDVDAKNFVYGLKDKYGNGISAKCMIYNATGDTVTYSGKKDWHGHIYESPYPAKIQNGQWGAFLHVHPSWFAGSESAIIYRGFNGDGQLCDWMQSWGIPYVGNNHAYTEIREGHHYETDHWDYIKSLLESQSTKYEDTWNGCQSNVTIGEGTSPEFVGIMSLEGVTTK
ncbi:23 kDa jasmonate-induced protein-like [Ziziphus jujuba]|uniref:23 kDa jasmonate-induced protein-like n=1 Tax=Ziziphus jujuba TaxID=326968 RepID=A0A6P3ZMV0_ZIZJJ|nr:23 kDa jasmonate-induced protein-like [Ziziphus jujuba]